MSLDACPSDDELRRIAQERNIPRVRSVALVPDAPPRQPRKPGKRTGERVARRLEHDIQVALFALIDNPLHQLRWPALAMCFAVPNGGHRSPRTAGRLKAEGVRAGVLDIWLPVSRGGFHGLALELKRPGGTTSPSQADWMAALVREGWRVLLHTNEDAAFQDLTRYLDLP